MENLKEHILFVMRVTIVNKTSQFQLEVGLTEPILQIKRRLQQLLGVPVAAQTLSAWGWELVDGLDMDDYPAVTDGTRIDLTIKPKLLHPFSQHADNKFIIIVNLSSRQTPIEVDATDTVRSLKEKIHIIHGTPIKRMALFLSGTELDNDFRNLTEYGIHEFAEIMVNLKSMGQCNNEPLAKMLRIVVQTSSCLLNSATIPVEVTDSSTVGDLKQLLLSRKILPRDDYLFIHKQRIMRDQCSLRWHGVDTGDVLYVFKGTVVTRQGF